MSKIDERFCMGIFNNSLNIYTIFFFFKNKQRGYFIMSNDILINIKSSREDKKKETQNK